LWYRHSVGVVPEPDPRAYELAYEEGVRALSQQQAVVDNFRTRAGILLSAAAIATSFLGGQALREGSFSAWSWLAVAAFAGVALLALLILWPRRDWEFVAAPRRLIGTYVETADPLPLEQIHRDLALHMENSYDENASRLQAMIGYFRGASILLAVEVVLWIVDIASGP
jgi:hypothetical protein